MNYWPLVVALCRWEVLLALSLLLTLAHTLEEVRGEGGPLWRYLARTSGAEIPDAAGVLLIAFATPAFCWTLTLLAYATREPFWLGAVFGVRAADALCTHLGPWLLGSWLAGCRPNPGVYSALLYGVEAVLLIAVVPLDPWGVLLGALPFIALWPLLALAASLRSHHVP